MHYFANKVRRQFGLDQDILDDFSTIMESTISVRPFLQHSFFEFWSRRFTAVTIRGSQREGICTTTMLGYWQAVMISFEQELLGSRGFSLIPPNSLHAIISTNPRLLLPTKYVLAYARKKSWFAIFKWDAKEKGWYLYAGEYPTG